MGFMVLIHVLVIPIIMLFFCLVKLFIIFLSVVETLVIVYVGRLGGIFTRSSGFINFIINLIHCMGMTVFL